MKALVTPAALLLRLLPACPGTGIAGRAGRRLPRRARSLISHGVRGCAGHGQQHSVLSDVDDIVFAGASVQADAAPAKDEAVQPGAHPPQLTGSWPRGDNALGAHPLLDDMRPVKGTPYGIPPLAGRHVITNADAVAAHRLTGLEDQVLAIGVDVVQ